MVKKLLGLLIVVLIPVLIGALYLTWKPGVDSRKHGKLLLFNRLVFLLILVAWLGSAGNCWVTIGQGVDRAWWPFVAVLSGLFFTSIILLLALFLRNFLLFRR